MQITTHLSTISQSTLNFFNTSGWATSSDPSLPYDTVVRKIVSFVPIFCFLNNNVKENLADQLSTCQDSDRKIKLLNVSSHFLMADTVRLIAEIALCVLKLLPLSLSPVSVLIGLLMCLQLVSIYGNGSNFFRNEQQIQALKFNEKM